MRNYIFVSIGCDESKMPGPATGAIMSEPLLAIRNNHAPTCGDPPIIRNDSKTYLGYFENCYGEQWIFTFDRETRSGMLRGGDVGWTKEYLVRDGQAPELVLSSTEQAWLKACWQAATELLR